MLRAACCVLRAACRLPLAACCVLRTANCKRALVAYMAGGLASLVLLVMALGILLHPVIMVTVGVAMGG